MWRGYDDALKAYMNACIDEWVRRGFVNNMEKMPHASDPEMPPWLGDPDFHRSHQSNLVRKDPAYYRRIFPDVPDDLPVRLAGEVEADRSALAFRAEVHTGQAVTPS